MGPAVCSASEIVEQDVFPLHAQIVQHLQDRLRHQRRSAHVIFAVLGRRVVAQVILEEHLVNEARGYAV